jgi:mannose-6-phosphate isomerase-like protein (cupin superfamily)
MATIIAQEALSHSATSCRFEGAQYGEVAVSFFLTDAPPGTGPKLHTHPYAEVFVVQEGEVIFTVGEETIPAVSGQIVIVPPCTPHKFVNAGTERARHIDIHASGWMETAWLED